MAKALPYFSKIVGSSAGADAGMSTISFVALSTACSRTSFTTEAEASAGAGSSAGAGASSGAGAASAGASAGAGSSAGASGAGSSFVRMSFRRKKDVKRLVKFSKLLFVEVLNLHGDNLSVFVG